MSGGDWSHIATTLAAAAGWTFASLSARGWVIPAVAAWFWLMVIVRVVATFLGV